MSEMFSKRVSQHRAIEAKIKEISERHEAELKPFKDAKAKLRALMLDMLNQSGLDSAKTDEGTVYKTGRTTASLEDADAFKRHVIGTEHWDLADWKANVTACTDFAEANKHLPPGVKLTTMLDVGVRAPVRKKPTPAEKAGKLMQAVAEAGEEPTAEQQQEIEQMAEHYSQDEAA